ncbi:glycogen synthase GlgA [Bradyrhizobium sp. WD16]|uniref:glycogen synthase GlgA n=1 Tax=Bradyrhizobium sp. WD16 TaxID=1521768 RepID=UPI0020A2BB2E|nr:glycogen synthase GlgA [Bradyrhizobium sp. WD16]UTD30444.1 glycogen synthase GlgA [Bradyrhizobium sp. WD16]
MSIRVLFVTPELEDYVRVGGLASVSAALPRAMRSRVDVRLMLPGYRAVLRQLDRLEIVGACEPLGEMPACLIGRTATADGLAVYVVICPELYDREGTPYGDANGSDWIDNDLRFARFGSAAAFLAAGFVDPSWSADVVHANDWQSGLVPAYLAWHKLRVPSLLTIHNLAYQGLFPRETLRRIGAPDSSFHIEGVEFYDKVSFLKGGLVYSDHLTTVSATYAREITTAQFGCGLDGLLKKRANADQLTGILNGIDESWDPRVCPELATPFGAGDWRQRQDNTRHVRKQFNLALSRGPLFALVARLVHQKGVDFVLDAAETIVAAGGQIVVMGRGEPRFERALQEAQSRRPQSIGVAIGFEDAEARRIFAGSDFTLMPSRFEPCGLSQMYAQRFGSLPIGHKTGGLADTIVDGRTGFLFAEPSTQSFLGAVCRAFATFGRKRRINAMRTDAMASSFAWRDSVATYHGLYRQVRSPA